jgi:HEAT repeat protein
MELAAVPALQKAVRSTDPEIRRRARVALKRIQQKFSPATTIAAVHLLALQRPAGAASALLDYLPTAPEAVAREVRAALYHLGNGGSRPDPVLLATLKDANPARRAAAEAALGKDGGAYARLPNRRVFRPEVRRPRKVIVLLDKGTTRLELQVQEQRFYNRFDDKLFARP